MHMEINYNSEPSKDRARSYSGGYMALGKAGEEIAIDWLKNHPQVVDYDDLRELRPMQKADVDCQVFTTDGKVALIEIKTDAHLGSTGNVVFEALRINHTCHPDYAVTLGWSARSPATFILYVAIKVNEIWIARFDDFRRAVQEYTGEKRKGTRLVYTETDNLKSTVNILLPVDYAGCFKRYQIGD